MPLLAFIMGLFLGVSYSEQIKMKVEELKDEA